MQEENSDMELTKERKEEIRQLLLMLLADQYQTRVKKVTLRPEAGRPENRKAGDN